MKQFEIKITKSTRYVDFGNDNEKVGNIGENLQTMLVFSFIDEFVNGQARLEYTINGENQYVFMEKVGETYQTPVTSQLAQCGSVDLQLVITEGTDENEIPKFKSNVFYLPFGKSINAEVEQAEGYEEWIDVANTKLNKIDESVEQANNLDINANKIENITTINVTKKDGSTQTVKIYDGQKGDTYEITEEDYEEIENQVKNDIQPILEKIENTSKQAEIIAKGKATGYVFDTLEDLELWLQNETNVNKLVLGDNLYIRTIGVPDYWWDGSSKQVLETEKPDLTEYAKKEQFVTLTQAEYDNLTEKSANTYYFIIEEE